MSDQPKTDFHKQERVMVLAEKVRLLLGFCYDLIADRDLLIDVAKLSGDRENFATSTAPILGALGMDYEEEELEARIRRLRSNAILNLVDILRATESEREEFKKKQAAKMRGREEMRRILGG